jgi:hypoxanthine phosphoribosyltransferase
MQSSTALARQPVVSLDTQEFDAVCADLMAIVHRDSAPDLVVGIPTGGAYVAQAMTRAVKNDLTVLKLTCRRPSSNLKKGSPLKKMLTRLPRPVVDQLRVIEHAVLTRKPARPPAERYQFLDDELERITAWFAAAGRSPSVLVVDDAVDSGATLLQVIDRLRAMAPHGTTIRSAVVTVTTDRPLILPDYTMFHRQLCRFPWSLDAR